MRGVALAMLVAVLTMVSVDKLFCADGCCSDSALQTSAHHDDHATHTHANATCIFCTLGVEVVQEAPAFSPLDLVGTTEPPTVSLVRSVPARLLDRPPRPATV